MILGHVIATEFQAKSQAALLRRIAKWFADEHEKGYGFLLDIRFELREQDIDQAEPYKAVVYVDGGGPLA
jgi:hypothetical protein